jgi:hypothetical protein
MHVHDGMIVTLCNWCLQPLKFMSLIFTNVEVYSMQPHVINFSVTRGRSVLFSQIIKLTP